MQDNNIYVYIIIPMSISKEYLIEEYSNKKLKIEEISNKCNLSKSTVSYYIKKYKIPKIKHFRQFYKKENLINKKFGNLIVLKEIKKTTSYRERFFLCKCICGKEKIISKGSLKKGNTKSCGCLKNTFNFKGYKDISGSFWNKTKKNAKKRKLIFDIDIQYVWLLYEQQNKKCALSNLPIYFVKNNDKDKDRTASIDRINPKLGYIKGNIQIVHKAVNFMKSTLDNDIFIYICKKIADNNKNTNIDENKLKYNFTVGSSSVLQIKT